MLGKIGIRDGIKYIITGQWLSDATQAAQLELLVPSAQHCGSKVLWATCVAVEGPLRALQIGCGFGKNALGGPA